MNSNLPKNLPVSGFKTYMRLFGSIRAYKFTFGIAVLGILIAGIAEASIYKFVAPQLLDQGVITKNAAFVKLAPFYVIGVFLIRGIGDFLGKYFMAYVGRSVVRDHRVAVLTHMLQLPVAFFDQHTTGELISKVNYDVEQVAIALSDSVLELFKGTVTVIFLFAVMLSISWQITLTVLVIIPVVNVYFRLNNKRMRRYSTRVQNAMGNVTHVASEIIDAHKVIRMFQGEDFERERIKQVTDDNRKQELKVALVMACSEPIMLLIGAFALATLIYLATLKGLHITPGEFIGLFGAMFGLIRPIKLITQVNNVLQRGIAAAGSIHSLLDEPVEADVGVTNIQRAQGRVSIKNVKFAYTRGSTGGRLSDEVLKGISFKINPGETIALVGRSGGGKSSLAALLSRFYDLQQGQILLDNVDIRDIKLADLRRQIAVVTQQVILFNDTVANNIAYGGKRDATRADIIAAANAACAMEFIECLPQGMDTIIGQNGILLSGGQRQRLAIARAILKNAPILILDEATSALDTESENKIQMALNNVMYQRTTLVIAHRLSTIEKADQILVLEGGNIVEIGTHRELMQQNSRYAQLQQLQDREFIPV